MRFVAADGRASLVRGDAVFDVAECSDGAIPADPMSVLRDHWDDLAALALAGEGRPLGEVTLGAPVPRPPLVLSLIANYPPAGKSGFPMIESPRRVRRLDLLGECPAWDEQRRTTRVS